MDMADPEIPSEMQDYMRERGWPEHHAQWHYEQRHDYWHHLAANGNPNAAAIVAEGEANGWGRSPTQEGAPGHGVEFLSMHRAMFELLYEQFPQHSDYLRGWTTPPQDPADPDDPVPNGAPFDPDKAAGVIVVETRFADFPIEDDYALFLETSIRPTATDPTYRIPDNRTNLHNWLHNRWADGNSPVDLGNPRVNIFNARFWRLHGWIERLWSAYRADWNLSDDDPAHRGPIDHHKEMMRHLGHHHHSVELRRGTDTLRAGTPTRSALSGFFEDEG
jgi:hypothetical protein